MRTPLEAAVEELRGKLHFGEKELWTQGGEIYIHLPGSSTFHRKLSPYTSLKGVKQILEPILRAWRKRNKEQMEREMQERQTSLFEPQQAPILLD